MSAILKEFVFIDVTRGDCLESNRKSGKSNTGTYFICSKANFEEFESYFNKGNEYIISKKNIEIYKNLFNMYFKKNREEYPGKMDQFDLFCNYLLSTDETNLYITLRINDSRVFMRFVDNSEKCANAIRNILYEDISKIVLEKIGEKRYLVYPVINQDYLEVSDKFADDFILDE